MSIFTRDRFPRIFLGGVAIAIITSSWAYLPSLLWFLFADILLITGLCWSRLSAFRPRFDDGLLTFWGFLYISMAVGAVSGAFLLPDIGLYHTMYLVPVVILAGVFIPFAAWSGSRLWDYVAVRAR